MTAAEQLTKRFAAAMMPNYGVPPVALVGGKGCQLWDADGKEYPRPDRRHRGERARARSSGAGQGRHQPGGAAGAHQQPVPARAEIELAERLLELLGADGRVFFANSGTEANEAALKVVRRAQEKRGNPGRKVIVAAEHGFHGRTMGALALTGKASIREPFGPFGLPVRFVPYGDAAALADAVTADVAAVFLEPCQGEAGVVPPPGGIPAGGQGSV